MNSWVATISILAAVVLASGCSTTKPPPTGAFLEDWTGLYLSVTKSFGATRTYYVGSDDKWSYFETAGESFLRPTYRKVETSTMKLSGTFPFYQGKRYRIQLSDFGHQWTSRRVETQGP